MSNIMERALVENDDRLYRIAVAVESDAALNEEMRQWRDGMFVDITDDINYEQERADRMR